MLARRLARRPAGAPAETALELYARRLDDIGRALRSSPEGAGREPVAAGPGPPRASLGTLALTLLVTVGLAAAAAFLVHHAVDRRAVEERSRTRERLKRLAADAAAPLAFCAVVVAIYLVMRSAGPTAARVLAARGWDPDATLGIVLPLTALPLAYALWLVARHRRALRRRLSDSLALDARQGAWLGLLAPALAVYLVGVWLLAVDARLRGEPDVLAEALGSLLLLAAPLAARWARTGLEHLYATGGSRTAAAPGGGAHVAASPGPAAPVRLAPAEPGPSARHVTRLMRSVWAVLAVAVVLAAALLWGIDPSDLGAGHLLLRLLLDVGVVLLLGYVGWALFQRWVDRRIELARSDADATRAQRLQTCKGFVC